MSVSRPPLCYVREMEREREREREAEYPACGEVGFCSPSHFDEEASLPFRGWAVDGLMMARGTIRQDGYCRRGGGNKESWISD